MYDCFVILPNQLYENVKMLKKYNTIILIEEPIYFYDAEYRPIRPNKIKIAYMRACMKSYKSMLETKVNSKVVYQDCEKVDYSFIRSFRNYSCYSPTDYDVVKKFNNVLPGIMFLPSPNFIFSEIDLKDYKKQYSQPRHATFYSFAKRKLGINLSNMDTFNRSSPDSQIYSLINKVERYNNTFYKEGKEYAEKQFSNHYGNSENLNLYPITIKDAYANLDKFLKNKLSHFGRYQDVFLKDHVFIFHANISASLNIGLLDPNKVVEIVKQYYKRAPLPSFEGFLRQIIGWREYTRYLYLYYYKELTSSNLPRNMYKFDNNVWYTGKTGVFPFDNEVHKALEHGYAHHIVRLMVFLNFFIICNIDPKLIYKWFMEIVSIDAYDWVMVPNIYGMGYFSKISMTKPYISSAAYLLRMSDYKKDNKWDVVWTALFYYFLKTKPKEYLGPYQRNLASFRLKLKSEQDRYMDIAKDFLARIRK